jgi:hypothetical protein
VIMVYATGTGATIPASEDGRIIGGMRSLLPFNL